jgi:hypothetical protein
MEAIFEQLERRRRRALKGVLAALAVAVFSWPLGFALGSLGGENWEAVGGAFFYTGIAGMIAAPVIVRAWQRGMGRQMLDALIAHRPDIRHVDGERGGAVEAAFRSGGFDLDGFKTSGLVERFASSSVRHVLTGQTAGVPFALAEISLFEEPSFRVFSGVLASFALPWNRPGLTIVTRDRGLLGNLVAGAGSAIERITLEDPTFEGVFEAYGTDQVLGRVILTTTMLERLRQLDELAHAQGFVCAFQGGRLLIALRGMHWHCPARRILQPTGSWLPGYRAWLTGLVDLPAQVAATLRLHEPDRAAVPPAPAPATAVAAPGILDRAGGHVGQAAAELYRLGGRLGLPAIYIASGTMFGGLALFFGWMGLTEGFGAFNIWQVWLLIGLGVGYGIYAIALGATEILRFAWSWKAPLRGLGAAARKATGSSLWR